MLRTASIVGRSIMASSSSPFSQAAVNAMRRLYPEALADKSFDNTGLLLEAPFHPRRRRKNSILLTIDLTRAVANEAIERKASLVVAYHPIIFRGLKSLTFADSQQESLLRLAAEGISVYCPHTAVDAAPGGLGDWLADIVTGTPMVAETVPDTDVQQAATPESRTLGLEDPFVDRPGLAKRPTYRLQHHPSQLKLTTTSISAAQPHTRSPITPSTAPGFNASTGAGMGRLVQFQSAQALTSIVERIAVALNRPRGIPIAIPQDKQIGEIEVRSVAVCAGSGGGVFRGLKEPADLLLTGEMSHHEALAAIEQGQCVIALFHSNTERGFLSQVLQGQLRDAIDEEWQTLRESIKQEGRGGEQGWGEVLLDDTVEVLVSECDRDPYGIMIADDL